MIFLDSAPRLYQELSMAEVNAKGFLDLVQGEVGRIEGFQLFNSIVPTKHRKRSMTAINMALVNRSKDVDELAGLLPGNSWMISTEPSRENPEVYDVQISFVQRNTVRGKITRTHWGRLHFKRPKSFCR